MRMRGQNRGGGHRADRAFKARFDGLRFARIGDNRDDRLGFQNLPDGHGDRLHRNFREISEPSFADLLLATGFVEIHDDVGFVGIEIGGRIVEGEMAVFADAGEGEVNRRGADCVAGLVDDFRRSAGAVEQVVMHDAGFIDQAFLQVFAEAGGMRHRDADVFVEME